MYIGTPTEFPRMKERAISLQPGFEHFLDLSGQVVTSEGIETVDPQARHCYFSNEGNLDFYSNYTYGNCIFECGMKHAARNLSCIPWYLPQSVEYTSCDPWTARLFIKMVSVLKASKSSECNHCLPDCEETSYSTVHSSVQFRLNGFIIDFNC